MTQNAQQVNPALTPGKVSAPLNLDAQGDLLTAQGSASAMNLSANAVVKASPGRLVRVSVTTAGAAGELHDCAAVADAAAGNLIGIVPAVVGVYNFDWPCGVGIVYKPGAAQVVSISFR